MGDLDFNQTTHTSMATTVRDFSVAPRQPDAVGTQKETIWNYNKFYDYLGYYNRIPELKKAIDALVLYTVGKGFTTEIKATQTTLEYIKGVGKETITDIFANLLIIKKICGDAFAEIIRENNSDTTSQLLNLKVLDPGKVTSFWDPKGRILRYEVRSNTGDIKTLQPNQMLHLMNDRVADELHGTSVVGACQWVIDAKNEAMSDWRRISHRSTIRVMYIDADNQTKINQVKTEYATAVKNGELMIIPAKKGEAEFQDLMLPPVEAFLAWIKYLDDAFYQAVGVPKVVLGGSSEFTEASSKTALLTFDQVWENEQTRLQDDLWNQLYIKLTFYKPTSLKNELISDEQATTAQGTGFQPNDAQIGSAATG